MEKWLYLIAGGAAGTLARYVLTGAVHLKTGLDFPYGTLAVNLLGCFLVGFLDVLAERKFPGNFQLRLLFVTGFCGAFTTFSAFILESYSLVRAGEMLRAFLNVFGSVAAGLICFRVGILLGQVL